MCVRVSGTRIEAAWLVNAKTNRRDSHTPSPSTIYEYAYVPYTRMRMHYL